MHVGYVKSPHKDDKPPLNETWSGFHGPFFYFTPVISLKLMKLCTSKFCVLIDTEEYEFMRTVA